MAKMIKCIVLQDFPRSGIMLKKDEIHTFSKRQVNKWVNVYIKPIE